MSERDKLDILLYNTYINISDENRCTDRLKLIAKHYKVNVDYIHNRYLWLVNMGIDPNYCHLDENHTLVYRLFDEYNKMLNENNIEYYYTSGILAYLLVDKDLERYHHDLDIFINMEHLEKLEQICDNYNFSFKRKIGDRGDGTKRVMLKMYYKDIVDIPITVFMYVREKDDSITQKDYFIDENNRELVEYIHNSPLISKLSFSEFPKNHNGIRYYSITPEALFLCKTGNRPKDIYDCTVFNNIIDKNKLEELSEAFKYNLPNNIVEASNDEFSNYIFKNNGPEKIKVSKNVLTKHD